MVSVAYSNLAPDFREIWINCRHQGFGRTYDAKRCISRFVFPRLLSTGPPPSPDPIFQLTAVIDVA
jgi:hypothetical protein